MTATRGNVLFTSTVPGTAWATYAPTVTLGAGAGNVVPQYTVNQGRYTQFVKIVFATVTLTGDGGNEGAGTGILYIALPVTAGASVTSAMAGMAFGMAYNAMAPGFISSFTGGVMIAAGATSFTITEGAPPPTNLATMTGADQAPLTREIHAQFCYEVD